MRLIEPTAVAMVQREKQETFPEVAILLCTFQGQRFLHEQLASIESQSLKAWTLLVSDDGSSDNTLDILQEYQKAWCRGQLNLQSGPRQGFAANFLSLTCQADIKTDFYAYADQDDIWEADKLERAVNWLKTIPADVPALYCSRTRLVDEENRTLGFSPLFKRPPCFANALMQNIGGGNTMVFNHATRKLLCQAGTCYHDNGECDCRKPLPGALLAAAKLHEIDLSQSFMVGDRWRDIEAGHRAGCKSIFIDYGYAEKQPVFVNHRVISLQHATEIIMGEMK